MKKANALEIMTCYCLRYSPKSAVGKDHLQKERKRERDTRSAAQHSKRKYESRTCKQKQTKPNWTKWNQNKYMLNGEQIAENLKPYTVRRALLTRISTKFMEFVRENLVKMTNVIRI